MSLFSGMNAARSMRDKVFVAGRVVPAAADEEVVTGLDVVDYGGCALRQVAIATHDRSVASPGTTAGTLRIRSYKPTAEGPVADVTPIASTANEQDVNWWAVGTVRL